MVKKTAALSQKTSSVVSIRRIKEPGNHAHRHRVKSPPHIKWISKDQKVTHRLFECLGCGATGFRFDSSRGQRHLACVKLLAQAPNSAGTASPQEAGLHHEDDERLPDEDLAQQPTRSRPVGHQAASVMSSAAQSLGCAMKMYEMLGGAAPDDVRRAMALVVDWARDASKTTSQQQGGETTLELAAAANVERYRRWDEYDCNIYQ